MLYLPAVALPTAHVLVISLTPLKYSLLLHSAPQSEVGAMEQTTGDVPATTPEGSQPGSSAASANGAATDGGLAPAAGGSAAVEHRAVAPGGAAAGGPRSWATRRREIRR